MIGAGPGGLAAARWLLAQGFEPTIFEKAPMLGGQWTGLPGLSGVWPAMHTNSSRTLTAFGDLEHDTELVYPPNREILAYLHRYAEKFGLTPRLLLGTRVDLIRRHSHGWLVRHDGVDDVFARVVVATGRFHTPAIPAVPGLETFAGAAGAIPSYQYRDPAPYRAKRVLVAGVPSDSRIYTRYGALASESLPAAEIDRQLKEIVVEAAGSPEQYGAPAPDPSLFAAGVTLNQHYLPLVAEGRITVRPWMKAVAGSRVTFADGNAEDFDGIVFGTGFTLSLPFLSEDIRAVLDLDAVHMDADRYTFHPDLPGMAFVGMWDQSGGYFVPLELQARWIAYAWGGAVPAPAEEEQRRSIDAYRSRRGSPQKTQMHLAAMTFVRAAGVEPHLENWPQLRRALLFGPLAPSCFRLEGPDALDRAPAQLVRDAAAFGAITSNELTGREAKYWSLVENAVN